MEAYIRSKLIYEYISVDTEQRCYTMLKEGMVEKWLAPFHIAEFLSYDENEPDLLFGDVLKSTTLYIAVSKAFPKSKLRNLKQNLSKCIPNSIKKY